MRFKWILSHLAELCLIRKKENVAQAKLHDFGFKQEKKKTTLNIWYIKYRLWTSNNTQYHPSKERNEIYVLFYVTLSTRQLLFISGLTFRRVNVYPNLTIVLFGRWSTPILYNIVFPNFITYYLFDIVFI